MKLAFQIRWEGFVYIFCRKHSRALIVKRLIRVVAAAAAAAAGAAVLLLFVVLLSRSLN